jgi:hypothetical protein
MRNAFEELSDLTCTALSACVDTSPGDWALPQVPVEAPSKSVALLIAGNELFIRKLNCRRSLKGLGVEADGVGAPDGLTVHRVDQVSQRTAARAAAVGGVANDESTNLCDYNCWFDVITA